VRRVVDHCFTDIVLCKSELPYVLATVDLEEGVRMTDELTLPVFVRQGMPVQRMDG
jgi:uncharacterized OB-fold protein